jgi:MFS family permease
LAFSSSIQRGITVPDRSATYRDVFAVREYRYLFAAYTLSLLGDQLSAIAVSYLVYTTTGSAALAAAAFATSYLAWLLGGPVLSGVADRFPRRRVMISCDVARALLMPVAAIPGAPAGALVALLLVVNLLRPPFVSARASLMPDVLDGDRYPVANGLDNIVSQVSQVLGFAVGGALVVFVSLRGAVLADAATFAVSAALLRIGVRARPSPAATGSPLALGFVSAARFVFTEPRLRAYLLVLWVSCAFTFASEGLISPLSVEYHGGPLAVGLLLACAPLGMAAGGTAITRLCPPHRRPALIVPLATLATAALIGIWLRPPLWSVALLLMVAGVGSAFAIPLNSMFGRAVPTEYRGRAFGLAITGLSGWQGLAMALAGVAGDTYRATTVIGASGALGTVAVLALARLWPRERDAARPAHGDLIEEARTG